MNDPFRVVWSDGVHAADWYESPEGLLLAACKGLFDAPGDATVIQHHILPAWPGFTEEASTPPGQVVLPQTGFAMPATDASWYEPFGIPSFFEAGSDRDATSFALTEDSAGSGDHSGHAVAAADATVALAVDVGGKESPAGIVDPPDSGARYAPLRAPTEPALSARSTDQAIDLNARSEAGVAGASDAVTGADIEIFTLGELVTPGNVLLSPELVQTGLQINLEAFRGDPLFAGIDGSGSSVVILDSGLDLDHPFFGPDADGDGVSDRIVYQQDFADSDFNVATTSSVHGTHVTSIAASSDPTYSGVAPGADIIHLKVFKDSGPGYFSYIDKALDWVVANAEAYNIVSVNMSLSDDYNHSIERPYYGIGDELAALAALDVITVSASGNHFYKYDSSEGVGYPSADPNSLSVGAVYDADVGAWSYSGGAEAHSTDADVITPFSQRDEDLTTVFAPGAPITAAGLDGGLATLQGTSMAAPHVAGMAALAQQLAVEVLGRKLTVAEFTDLLVSSASTIVDGDDEDDNVDNTGLSFPLVDMLGLGNAIVALAPTPAGPSSLSIAALDSVKPEGDGGTTAFTFTVSRTGDTGGTTTVDYAVSGGGAASGSLVHASAVQSGLHQHYFHGASETLTVAAGDTLFAHVYLDPATLPDEVMLQWNDGSWHHRAYWGENAIGWGADGTTSRHHMGPLPEAGQWVRLEVAAGDVGLEGAVLNGMAFTLFGGAALWDHAGVSDGVSDTVWVDDALPAGAVAGAEGGDTWAFTAFGDTADAADFGGSLPAGTVSFAPGETGKTVTVEVSGDGLAEPDEGFTVTLSNPSGAATITGQTASGTIQNDDAEMAEEALVASGDDDALFDFSAIGENDGVTATSTHPSIEDAGSDDVSPDTGPAHSGTETPVALDQDGILPELIGIAPSEAQHHDLFG